MAWLRSRNTAQDAATTTNAKPDANRTWLANSTRRASPHRFPVANVHGTETATWKFEVASEFSLNGLDPKKAPPRGSPGQFSDLRKGTLKIRKLTGCPTRGGLFRIKPFGPCLRISKSPSQTDAVGLTAWHMARANKVRLTGCGWRHVLRLSTRVVWLRRPELCYECAATPCCRPIGCITPSW